MLSEALELYGTPGYHIFNIPWSAIALIPYVHFLEQLREDLSESASRAEGVSLVNVVFVASEYEEFH